MSTVLDAVDWAEKAEQASDDIEALETTKAPLVAVYGPGGTYADERSSLVSAIADELRLSAHAAGQKITESAVEARSRADRRVLDRVHLAREERTQMALIDARINRLTRTYELARARLYLTGRLAGLQ